MVYHKTVTIDRRERDTFRIATEDILITTYMRKVYGLSDEVNLTNYQDNYFRDEMDSLVESKARVLREDIRLTVDVIVNLKNYIGYLLSNSFPEVDDYRGYLIRAYELSVRLISALA